MAMTGSTARTLSAKTGFGPSRWPMTSAMALQSVILLGYPSLRR